jgi:tetratricopeptide (TPR) repeat protein
MLNCLAFSRKNHREGEVLARKVLSDIRRLLTEGGITYKLKLELAESSCKLQLGIIELLRCLQHCLNEYCTILLEQNRVDEAREVVQNQLHLLQHCVADGISSQLDGDDREYLQAVIECLSDPDILMLAWGCDVCEEKTRIAYRMIADSGVDEGCLCEKDFNLRPEHERACYVKSVSSEARGTAALTAQFTVQSDLALQSSQFLSNETAELALRLWKEGNELFRHGGTAEGAVGKYVEAARLLGDTSKPATTDDMKRKADECRVKCVANIGSVSLKLGRFDDAVEWHTKAILLIENGALDGDVSKQKQLCMPSYFYRARARIRLGQLKLALVRASPNMASEACSSHAIGNAILVLACRMTYGTSS